MEQYASIVAEERADMSESADQPKPCAVDPSEAICGAYLLTMSLQAKTLDIALEGASVDRPGNSLYIGPPPAEIATLVANTRTAAQDVQAMADTYDACNSRCGDEFVQAYFAVADLSDQLAPWEPYI